MARKRRSPKMRTRTITKTRTRFRNIRGRIGGFRSRHKSKADHLVTITAGAGAGALTTTALQLITKNAGIALPSWAPYVASAITGLFVGKHVGHSWMKGGEAALASVATAYAETKVASGQPILNLQLGGSGTALPNGSVY